MIRACISPCGEDFGVTTTQSTPVNVEFDDVIELKSLDVKSHEILYGIAGDPKGTPVLFYPPLMGSRRMLLSLNDFLLNHSIKGICVNRPGIEESSHSSTLKNHVDRSCEDTIAVLDALGIDQAGILCMCAGTPFALIFYCRYPDRCSGKILAVAPWVLPADCPHSKRLNRFAANSLPLVPVSFAVGALESFMMNLFSKDTIASKLREKLSSSERQTFDERFNQTSGRTFARELNFIMGIKQRNTHDVAVCLSSSKSLGIDYEFVATKATIIILQAGKDNLVPVEAGRWLADQLRGPSSSPSIQFHVVPNGTHAGCLFGLHPEWEEGLNLFHQQ